MWQKCYPNEEETNDNPENVNFVENQISNQFHNCNGDNFLTPSIKMDFNSNNLGNDKNGPTCDNLYNNLIASGLGCASSQKHHSSHRKQVNHKNHNHFNNLLTHLPDFQSTDSKCFQPTDDFHGINKLLITFNCNEQKVNQRKEMIKDETHSHGREVNVKYSKPSGKSFYNSTTTTKSLMESINWRIIFFLLSLIVNSISCDRDILTYTDQFVLHFDGSPEAAKEIASKHGFVYLDQIFDNHYHLKHTIRRRRSIKPSHNFSEISAEPNVNFLLHLPVLSRTKRDLIKTTNIRSTETINKFNDPNWLQMWYLNRDNGLDMNVIKVWDQNITGRGVVVSILDDGLEGDHPDLSENYDPKASYDVNNSDDDPTPRYDIIDSNRHGTRCAGEVAAMANNNNCAVGVAYHAKVGGVRMLDGDVTDAVEARSIGFATDHIDIYSASWGPDDDGKTVDGPGDLAARAFVDGVTKGRNGLGSIYIWASGNGGREHDNCNCDGYTNSIWTLSVSSATENGQVPWYSEACSSTLATTYSSGSIGEKQIVTTDLHHSCTISHTGTSASAPLAAAIAALALEANRNLTWRDMQHIVAMTSRPTNLRASDWKTNGVGRKVSHSFGYGLMDAAAMVDLAKVWVTVPDQKICEIASNLTDKLIPSKSYVEMSLNVNCPEVLFLEHVQSRINLSSTRRGDIHIYLTSPAGTRSTLLEQRPMDNSHSGFQDWPFMTVHSWGENPNGIWKLEVHNDGKYPYNRAFLKGWTMVLHGTKINPDRRKRETQPTNSSIPTNSSTPIVATQLNIILNGTRKTINQPLNVNGLESSVDDNSITNLHDDSKADIFISHWTRENDRPKIKANSQDSYPGNSGCRNKGHSGCLAQKIPPDITNN
ncbi:furin-like protease 1 isoform X2 [Panonychus citri]|uniref:furin-like protease 1 isoform X2 n=1 Tax=Panonychus citri TaxID=50023 RepID=UPI002307E947|nr:furin-like protease 1 isoform X2 [Panonychus citri]